MAVEKYMAAMLEGIALFVRSIYRSFGIPFGGQVFAVGSYFSVGAEKDHRDIDFFQKFIAVLHDHVAVDGKADPGRSLHQLFGTPIHLRVVVSVDT